MKHMNMDWLLDWCVRLVVCAINAVVDGKDQFALSRQAIKMEGPIYLLLHSICLNIAELKSTHTGGK